MKGRNMGIITKEDAELRLRKRFKLRSERNNSKAISKSAHSAEVPTNVNILASKGVWDSEIEFFVCVRNISVLSSLKELCLLIAVSVCFYSEGKEIFFSLLCFMWCVCDRMLSSMNSIHWSSDVSKPEAERKVTYTPDWFPGMVLHAPISSSLSEETEQTSMHRMGIWSFF